MPAVVYGPDPVVSGPQRVVWGEPVSIPGVETFHPRSVWVEPCFPVSGRAQGPLAGDIYQPVAHYSAAANTPDGDIGEFDYQIIGWLRSVNRDYWINRKNATTTTICGRVLPGYSIGYLFAIDWLGGVWELRGFDYMPAANAGHNHYTCPIIFITDGTSQPTELAWGSARAVWREFRRRANRLDFVNRPLGHGELFTTTGIGTPTACPGAGVLTGLHAGYGDLDYDDTPLEVPQMTTLRDTTLLHDGPFSGEQLFMVTGDRPAWAEAAVIKVTVDDTPAQAGFVIAWDGNGDWRADPDRRGDVTWRQPNQTPTSEFGVPLHPTQKHTFKIEATTPLPRLVVELRGWNAVA